MHITSFVRNRWSLTSAVGAAAIAVGVTVGEGGVSAQPSACAAGNGFPFTSISCEFLERLRLHVRPAPASVKKSVPITEDQAAAAALRLHPDATLNESRLVETWSADQPGVPDRKRLVWIVSSRLAEGIYISSGGFVVKELHRLRPNGLLGNPLTEEELNEIDRLVSEKIRQLREHGGPQYRIDFIDPYTGEWLSAAEGGRQPGDRGGEK